MDDRSMDYENEDYFGDRIIAARGLKVSKANS